MTTPTPAHVNEEWRVVRALNLYRWVLAVTACALTLSGVITELFELMWPALFTGAWIGYLLLCLPTSFAAHWRKPGLRLQLYLLVAIDIAYVVALVLSSTGVNSGLGMLLIVPIAGASILLPARTSAALAAVASLSLLGQEVWRQFLYVGGDASMAQAGILGLLLFFSALTANALANRARYSAELAASRKSELDDMATLNERIIQRMQIGLVVVDEQRRIRLLNRAARQMLGLQHNSVGQLLAAVAPPLAWTLEAWQHSPSLTAEPFNTGQYALLPRFTRLGHGLDTPVLIFLEDAHRASEQAQQMKLAALGHLTASIAHEIRNPLSAISHASQLLDESIHLDASDHHMLDIVRRHSGRIEQIIQSVLGLSRRGKTEPSKIQLKDWLAGAISDYSHGREDAPHFIVDEIEPGLHLQCDPNQLRQILYNLWENAELHARVPGRELEVRLSATRTGNAICLDVADNGPGLRGHSLTQLIEPFFTTTREGTGLGLYIVRELCEGNFARLDVVAQDENTPGTCFRISFAAPDSWEAVQLPAMARDNA